MLQVTMFTCDSRGKILDPFFTLRFDRAEQGARGLTSFKPQIHHYMAEKLLARGMTAEEIEGRFQIRLVDAACVFHGMMGTDSTRRWAAIPRDRGQV